MKKLISFILVLCFWTWPLSAQVIVVKHHASVASIAFVNAKSGSVYNNSPTAIATGTFDVLAGNALAVFCLSRTDKTTPGTLTVTDTASPPNTFTQVVAVYSAETSRSIVGFLALNATAKTGDNVTCSTPESNWTANHVMQFSGIKTSLALDATAVGHNTGPTASLATATFSTTQASEVMVTMCREDTVPGTYTAGAGDIIPVSGGTDADGVAITQYQIYSTTQTNTTDSCSWAAPTSVAIIASFTIKGL